ncbi:hypothetical protein [Comamonas sp. JC664]|uniref:hypothetical protein n=1 Tax=Comamonas sp. JC664 TaxID=2801917 RepID=UPI003611F4D8
MIEKKMFSNTEELLPVISSTPRPVPRMHASTRTCHPHGGQGYTPKQVRPAVRVVPRVRKSS